MTKTAKLVHTEEYSGTIEAIDCRSEIPHNQYCRIRVRYECTGEAGHELVSIDLPESYIGRHITVHNQTHRTPGAVIRTQDIKSVGGLEKIMIKETIRSE